LRSPETENLDYQKPNKILISFLEDKGIAYLDLLPSFEFWASINSGKLAYFAIDGHPNEEGHKVIAEELLWYIRNNYERKNGENVCFNKTGGFLYEYGQN